MAGLTAAGLFILSLMFSFYIYTFWIRIALRYFKVSSLNPVSKLIYTLTDPLIHPLEKLSPKPLTRRSKFSLYDFIALIGVEVIKITVLSLVAFHTLMPIPLFLLYVIADLTIQLCDLLFLAILARVIMSFVNPTWNSISADILKITTQPLLILGRKIIPDISGFDFSPYIILMILKTITLFINANLPWRLL